MIHEIPRCNTISYFLPAQKRAGRGKFVQPSGHIVHSCLSSVGPMYWSILLKSLGRFVVRLYDKISRKIRLMKQDNIRFSNGPEDWKLFHRLRLHLAAHSACSVRTSVDSGFRKSALKREQRLLDSTAWGWQGDRHVKLDSPGLAEPSAAGKHNADSEKQPCVSV